ncbi:unnamed protein product [Brassica oleracea]
MVIVKSRYNINLTNSFVIVKIDPIKYSSFYCFPNWDDLYRGLHHPKFPIGRLKRVTNIDGFSKIVFDPIGVPEINALRLR